MLQTLARVFWGADTTSPKRWALVPPAVTPLSQTSPLSPSPQIGHKRVADPEALPNDRTTKLCSRPPANHPPLHLLQSYKRPQRSTSSSICPRTTLPSLRRSYDAFKALVDESLKHVTKKMALAFARKARMFKLAYHALADENDAKPAQGGGEQTPIPVSSTFKEIEDKVTHLKATTYKIHRGVSEALVPGEE